MRALTGRLRSMPVRRALASLVLLALLPSCGDAAQTSAASAGAAVRREGPVIVPVGEVAAAQQDRTIGRVAGNGRFERLGELPVEAGEPDAVAVSQDGRLVLVSAVRSDDDDASVCQAVVLQVLVDGGLQRIADGASLALSADGRRLAYFRHATFDGFCRRTDLVVRDLGSGAESTVLRLADAPVGATPPSWPVNWSPDGDRLVHVTSDGAVVTDAATGETVPVSTTAGRSALAPAWLPDGRLIVLDGCCIGTASMRTADGGEEVFAVDRPVRSIRPGRRGTDVWLAVEEGGLVRWDGTVLRPVLPDVLVASG